MQRRWQQLLEARADALQLDAFLRARHVMVNSPFSGHRLVDDALADGLFDLGVAMKIAAAKEALRVAGEAGFGQ